MDSLDYYKKVLSEEGEVITEVQEDESEIINNNTEEYMMDEVLDFVQFINLSMKI